LGLGERRGTEWTSLRIWEARGRRCQPRRAAPTLDDVVRSLSRGAGAVEAAPGASCNRAALEVVAAPGHAAVVPQSERAGTTLPGRQTTDLAGGARDPGLLRWICWRYEEERERGSAAAGRRTEGEGENRELDAGEGGGRAPGV